jgi:hypothetical protein
MTVRIKCFGMSHVVFVMRMFVIVVVMLIEGVVGRTTVGTTQVGRRTSIICCG